MQTIISKNVEKLDFYNLAGNPAVPYSFIMDHKHIWKIHKKRELIRIKLCSNPSTPVSYIRDMFAELFDSKNGAKEVEKNELKRATSKTSSQDVFLFLEANPQWIDWSILSENPEAIELLEKNSNKIDFEELAKNEKADKLFEKYLKLMRTRLTVWGLNPCIRFKLSKNPCAIDFLKAHPEFVLPSLLSRNPNDKAVEYLLKKHPRKVDMSELSENPSVEAVSYLMNKYEHIDWYGLSRNESSEAVNFLIQFPKNINWSCFSGNTAPEAISFIESEISNGNDEIDWEQLSENKNAIHILEKYPDRINFSELSRNTNPLIWDKCGIVLK